MADRFQNGLLLRSATASQCGRTFSRWLVEFAVQICGWTLPENSAGAGSYTNDLVSGSTGVSVTGEPQQFRDLTGTPFSGVSANNYITIFGGMPTGFEDRHGIYRIANVIDDNNIELDIRHSVHDAGIPDPATSMDWKIWRANAADVPGSAGTEWALLQGTGTQGGAYNFHVQVKQQATDAHFPQFQIGPFATFSGGVWTDGRNTTAFESWVASNLTDNSRIYACGDSDRIIVAVRQMDNSLCWNFLYIGEMDAFYDNSVDPNPVMLWCGNNSTSDVTELFGRQKSGSSTFWNSGRGLAANDTTTLSYLASYFQVSPGTGNLGWTTGTQRRWSARSSRIYRQSLIAESQTSGNMEMRGSLRGVWLGNNHLNRGTPFGRNSEFLHVVGGLIIPWNGSGVHEQRV